MGQTGDLIARGIEQLGLQASESLVQDLDAWLGLLTRWNRTYNLTAIRDPADMAVHHVLDSLALAPWLVDLESGARVIDVGTGAGAPGTPLALYFKALQFVLLDANEKKARFLTQTRIELGLANVEVVHGRAETMQGPFDRILCRAVASLAELSALTAHLLGRQGRVLAMKGKLDDDELAAELSGGLAVEAVTKIRVPFLDADRHIIVIRATA